MTSATDDASTVLLPGLRVSLLPKAVVVISAQGLDGAVGATTVAWNGVVSGKPPVVGFSLLPDSFCGRQVQETREFVVNVPGADVLPEVEMLGAHTGPYESKVGATGGSPRYLPSHEVRTPRLRGYFLHLECRLIKVVDIFSYNYYAGLVVAMHGRKDVVGDAHPRGDIDFSTARPILCFGDQYWTVGEPLGTTHENKAHPYVGH